MSTTLTEKVMMAWLGLTMFATFFVFWGVGLIMASLLGFVAMSAYHKEVTVDPPTFARRKIFGKLQPGVLNPRVMFALSLRGLFEELIVIDKTPLVRAEENELVFNGVRCKAQGDGDKKESGASVIVHIGLAFVPNDGEVGSTNFINKGKSDKVMRILQTMLGSAVREQAVDKTWEEYVFEKARLSMELITKLTGRQPTEKVLLNGRGKPIPDPDESRPHHKYQVEPRNGRDINEYDIENFIDTALIDNPPDIQGLGIRLSQLKVTQIDPEDLQLQEDSNRKAREKAQRAAEEVDFETERALADEYLTWAVAQGEKLTSKEALEMVRINRKRAREVIIRAPDTVRPLIGSLAGGVVGGHDQGGIDD